MPSINPETPSVNLDRLILADALSEIRAAHDCLLLEHPASAIQHLRTASDRIFRHLKDEGEVVA